MQLHYLITYIISFHGTEGRVNKPFQIVIKLYTMQNLGTFELEP